MSRNDDGDWQRTSPLAAIFFLGRIFRAIAKNAVQSIAPLAAYIFAADGSITRNAIVAIAVFLVGTVVVAILRYLFFRYSIRESSILIRDGILKKTQLDIRFDRIQAINTEQNLIFRPFDLVNVKIDTAGSSAQEGYLPAVSTTLADRLEDRLQGVRPASQEDSDAIVDRPSTTPPARRTLLGYGFGDLVRIGLTSNRALILLALLAPFMESFFEDRARRVDSSDLTDAANRATEVDLLLVAGFVVLVIVAGVLVLLGASIISVILRYYRFRLTSDGSRFRSVGGLLTRHEHSIRFAKIQALYLHQNLLQRLLGVYRLSVRQAASGSQSGSRSFLVPLLRKADIGTMLCETFGEEFTDAEIDPTDGGFARVARHYVRSNVFARGVLPALAATALLAPSLQLQASVALAWIPLSWVYFARRYRVLGVRIRDDGLAVRSGFIGLRVVAHLFRKVQRVTVGQSPFQRRRGLATLKLCLASGVVRIPYLQQSDAERLRDYILFRVESDHRAWH